MKEIGCSLDAGPSSQRICKRLHHRRFGYNMPLCLCSQPCNGQCSACRSVSLASCSTWGLPNDHKLHRAGSGWQVPCAKCSDSSSNAAWGVVHPGCRKGPVVGRLSFWVFGRLSVSQRHMGGWVQQEQRMQYICDRVHIDAYDTHWMDTGSMGRPKRARTS